MVIAHATNNGSPTTSTPWWIEYLKTCHNLHPKMLGSLRKYCVGNLSDDHPCVGIIVHVATCQYFYLIHMMLLLISQSGSTGDLTKAGLPKPVSNGLTVCAQHLTRFQHYLCIMLHPPTLLECHRNPSPSPVSQHLNPKVDNSQERHGSSSLTDKLLDIPKRSHVKLLKTRGDNLIVNPLQQTQCEGYHCQATKYL